MVEFDELLKRVQSDFEDIYFRVGKRFMYRPPRTVMWEKSASDEARVGVAAEQNYYKLQLLHEIGHAVLHHCDYDVDVERLKMERAAWTEARKLCVKYDVDYDEEFVEAELDTYRNWLYQRSRCPECGLVRYQDGRGVYHCPGCENL